MINKEILKKYHYAVSKSLLFNGIEPEVFPLLLKCLEPKLKSYDKNDFIFIAGDSFKDIGIIAEGAVSILREKTSGDRVVITILKQSDVFGETIAFSGLATWQNTVQALEKCKILFISKARITSECSKVCPWHKSLIENFLKTLSKKALFLNKKVAYMAIKGIRGKVGTYLYEQYGNAGDNEIKLSLNRNELADFLNVSRPSMSRELCRLRDEGVIDFKLKYFKILKPEELKSLSAF